MNIKVIFFISVFFVAFSAHAQKTFTQFMFTAQAVGWEQELVGVIDNDNRTITFATQRWIEDIAKLRATFTLSGAYEVKVGENVQVSGVTENDFRRNVVYTIDGETHYVVRFVSPQASGVPVIRIDTRNGAAIADRETWISTTFSMTDVNNPENDVSMTDFRDQIRGRGNSTWGYPKKAYRVRFRDNISLFGRDAHRNWILLAEFQDPTFLMNVVAFELGGNVFDNQPYTNTYRHVQVYLNGNYNGVYLLTEHRQASPNGIGAPGRVGIDQMEGWLVEIDSYWDEDPKFRSTNYNLPVMISSPEAPSNPGNSNNPFYDFVKNDINELCSLMASSGFPENGYRDLIDMDTFIDFLMVNDLVFNGELFHPKSVYSYKDKDGKISMGPLWDFDWGYGYAGSGHAYFNDNHNSSWGTPSMRLPMHSFFRRFFEDPVFLAKYKERWNEKYEEIVKIGDFIAKIGAEIGDAVAEDSKRWNISGGYWSGYDTDHARQIENMTAWWKRRTAWLNAEHGNIAFDGDGTQDSPLQISDARKLADLAALINSGRIEPNLYIKLMDDIDLSVYSGAAGWIPIGTDAVPFKGEFNGAGKKITGLNINSTGNYSGLFGYISEPAKIINLSVENINIAGGMYTGGIAGYINGGDIADCYVTGSVSGDDFVGGIVGFLTGNGGIANCYATSAVNGRGNVGGIAGAVSTGNITNCVALNPTVKSFGNLSKLDRSKWKFPGYDDNSSQGTIGYSSQATVEGASPHGRVTAMLDGNTSTFWHARWSAEPPATDYPHWFIVDLGEVVEFSGVMLQRRQNDDRSSTGYRLFTCEGAPTNQNDPVNGYAWINHGEFTFNPGINEEQTNWLTTNVTAQFVKMYFDVHHRGSSSYTMFAEFGLGNVTPSGGRVAGSNSSGALLNNYAWSLLEDINGESTSWGNKTPNGKDGADITMDAALSATFWTTAANWSGAGWNTNVWSIADGMLPVLNTEIAPEIDVTGVSLNKTEISLETGNSELLTATIEPANASDKSVTWSSSDESVATVDQNGTVTGVGAGTAVITVITVNSSIYATAAVTVSSGNVSSGEGLYANDIGVYPNPFTGETRIIGGAASLQIINAAGAVVHAQMISSHDETIRLEHLPAGVYVFRFEKDGEAKTVRVVKF